MSALGNSGNFKCEKTGLYLISAYIMTDTSEYVELQLNKNSDRMSSFSFPHIASGYKYRTSTFLTIQYLNLDDVLYVKAATMSHVYNDKYSCLSFLQLSNG